MGGVAATGSRGEALAAPGEPGDGVEWVRLARGDPAKAREKIRRAQANGKPGWKAIERLSGAKSKTKANFTRCILLRVEIVRSFCFMSLRRILFATCCE